MLKLTDFPPVSFIGQKANSSLLTSPKVPIYDKKDRIELFGNFSLRTTSAEKGAIYDALALEIAGLVRQPPNLGYAKVVAEQVQYWGFFKKHARI
ncbi:MAG: hypothetical protein FWH12_09005 [Treponema sp.]|nr:hypothetical protein [Treponema sp.]